MTKTCSKTGQAFEVNPLEKELRQKMKIEGEPEFQPAYRLMELSAFWPHWHLYKRTCDNTGQNIVTAYGQDCPHPVWHKDIWLKEANPPGADFNPSVSLFEQMWSFFKQAAIPHTIGTGNINCEYADDWWYSKNCFLCHSGVDDEDCRYCYRIVRCKDLHRSVFSFESERCFDLIYSHRCFQTVFAFNCWNCSDCHFLYDCRNCRHCFMCCNLRNKEFCFLNEQLSESEYKNKLRQIDFASRKAYLQFKGQFDLMLRQKAWHRALFNDRCENVAGNYLDECKNCQHCFFVTNKAEDCYNVFRGGMNSKDCLDTVSPVFNTELCYCSSIPQDQCYDIKYCFDVIQCRFMEYCGHCFQCRHCFGCCGLVGKNYYIFNKPYSESEYQNFKNKIIEVMKKQGEYGYFFPGYFAATPYAETLAGFYWPLADNLLDQFGFRKQYLAGRSQEFVDAENVPDKYDQIKGDITGLKFWDNLSNRPFQIYQPDIDAAKSLGVPLPHTCYAGKMQENFRYITFNGVLRNTRCGLCKQGTATSWPPEYDGRVLCEECYLKEVY